MLRDRDTGEEQLTDREKTYKQIMSTLGDKVLSISSSVQSYPAVETKNTWSVAVQIPNGVLAVSGVTAEEAVFRAFVLYYCGMQVNVPTLVQLSNG